MIRSLLAIILLTASAAASLPREWPFPWSVRPIQLIECR